MFQADTDREQQDFLLQQRRCSSPSSTFRFLRLLELMEAMCILPYPDATESPNMTHVALYFCPCCCCRVCGDLATCRSNESTDVVRMDETILFAKRTTQSFGQEACAVDCQCGHHANAMFSVPWLVPSCASVFVFFLDSLLRALVVVFAAALMLLLLFLLLLLFASKPNTAADTGFTNFASFQSAVRID